jgi:hypothetical protein
MDTGNSKRQKDAKQVAVPVMLVVPFALAVAAGAFSYLSDARLPVPGFYELAAQIIPILMIAFALESRATEFLSDPQIKVYRLQLFLFLLGGEIFALLGASGALRGYGPARHYAEGLVANSYGLSNLIAAGTAAGLMGGFAMLVVLALSNPGWLFLSFRQDPRDLSREVEDLNQKLRSLQGARENAQPEE